MKRVLITGGAGFVGANLTHRLLREGHEIHLLVRSDSNLWRIQTIQSDLHLHYSTIYDEDALIQLLKKLQPDWIFHLAAHGAYSWQEDITAMVQSNCSGTIALLNACCQVGFEVFVNTGSSSEYGFKDHPTVETDLIEPNSNYAVTKASATLYCQFVAKNRQLPIYTLRLYSVYGPYEEPHRLFPTLITKGMHGSWPPLVGPDTARDFIYVDDVVDAYLLIAKSPQCQVGTIYNVGTGIQTSIKQLAAIARKNLPLNSEPVWGNFPARSWDTCVWVADNQKIRNSLSWEPRYGVEQGFTAMMTWFKRFPQMQSFYEQTLLVNS